MNSCNQAYNAKFEIECLFMVKLVESMAEFVYYKYL